MVRAVVDGSAAMNEVSHEIESLAQRSGVALRYSSFWGEDLHVAENVLQRALRAMGVSQHAPHAQPTQLPPAVVVLEGAGTRIEWRGATPALGWHLQPTDAAEHAQGRKGEVHAHGDACAI